MDKLIPYGISAVGLVNRGFAENADQGQDMIDGFLGQYPDVNKFLKRSVAEALTRGYTQDPFGRIRWYEIPSEEEVGEEEHRRLQGGAARQAQNHKIQSMSANVTKQAMVDLLAYLKETGYGYIVLTVHDSVIFEIYKDHADETIARIKEIMEAAAEKIFPGMVAPVDIDVGHKEKRYCKVTGLPYSVYSHEYDFKERKLEVNSKILEPRVGAIMLKHGINVQDFNACFVFLENYIKTQPEEWHQENHDIVEAVQNIQKLHSSPV